MGAVFFSPADGYQPLRADFHRAESQSRVVSWCKYMRLDRGRAANCSSHCRHFDPGIRDDGHGDQGRGVAASILSHCQIMSV